LPFYGTQNCSEKYVSDSTYYVIIQVMPNRLEALTCIFPSSPSDKLPPVVKLDRPKEFTGDRVGGSLLEEVRALWTRKILCILQTKRWESLGLLRVRLDLDQVVRLRRCRAFYDRPGGRHIITKTICLWRPLLCDNSSDGISSCFSFGVPC